MSNDLSELVAWLNYQAHAFEACGYGVADAADKALALAKAQGRMS
jgi:hypothetical protein